MYVEFKYERINSRQQFRIVVQAMSFTSAHNHARTIMARYRAGIERRIRNRDEWFGIRLLWARGIYPTVYNQRMRYHWRLNRVYSFSNVDFVPLCPNGPLLYLHRSMDDIEDTLGLSAKSTGTGKRTRKTSVYMQ